MSDDTVIGAAIGRAGRALSESTPATVANMVPTTHQQYTFDFGGRNEGTALSSLPASVIKCPGGLLIPSPSALALCSTFLLFLSFTLSLRSLLLPFQL